MLIRSDVCLFSLIAQKITFVNFNVNTKKFKKSNFK